MSSFDRRDPRLKPIAGFFLLLATVLIIVCGGPPILTEERVEQRLQQFAAHITQATGQGEKIGSFTHGAVAMSGWGYDKHAMVSDVKLQFADKPPATGSWSVATPRMEVLPDASRPDAMVFEFTEPLTISENGQPKTTVNFPVPLRYTYFDGTESNVHTISHTLHLPPQLTLSPVGEQVGRIIVSYTDNPVFWVKSQPELHKREAVYDFRDIKVSGDDGNEASIGSLISRFVESQGTDGRPQGKYTLAVNNLVSHEKSSASKPYTINADLDYKGDVPIIGGINPLTASSTSATEVAINQLSLTSDDFKIDAQGALSTASDDPLPFGSVTLNIENVAQFLASDLIPESARKPLADAVQKSAGQVQEAQANAQIVFKRDKNGVFYVGNVTFEALAASVLADMLQLTPAAPAPVPAPATAPAPANAPAPAVATPAAPPITAAPPATSIVPPAAQTPPASPSVPKPGDGAPAQSTM